MNSAKNKKGQLAVAAVVKIIGIVLFIVVGIGVLKPLSGVGDRAAAEQCKKLFDVKIGLTEGLTNALGSLTGDMPDFMKVMGTTGVGGTASYASSYVPWSTADSGTRADLEAMADNQLDSVVQQTRFALFNALPEVCGTLKSKCSGSVREVSECIHERAAWAYWALGGGEYMPYGLNLDLFTIETQVTSPSDMVVYAGPSMSTAKQKEVCKEMVEERGGFYNGAYTINPESSVVTDMPFGTWCNFTAWTVNADTVAMSSLMNCYNLPGGPTNSQCRCFYHPSEGKTLDQGLRVYTMFDYYYPQYKGYKSCGIEQPEQTPDWIKNTYMSWFQSNCNPTALPGHEDEVCVLRVNMAVDAERPQNVTTTDDLDYYVVYTRAEVTQSGVRGAWATGYNKVNII